MRLIKGESSSLVSQEMIESVYCTQLNVQSITQDVNSQLDYHCKIAGIANDCLQYTYMQKINFNEMAAFVTTTLK